MSVPGIGSRLRYALRRLGWPGIAGLALAIFALVLHVFGSRELDAKLADTRSELEQLRARIAAAPAPVETAQMRLAAFLQFFPPPTALEGMLKSLHANAADHGLEIRNVEYRDHHDPASGLRRYQVTLPVKGGYPQIRAWLGETLNAQPTAALDGLQLKRDAIGSPQVEARIRLSFYLGES